MQVGELQAALEGYEKLQDMNKLTYLLPPEPISWEELTVDLTSLDSHQPILYFVMVAGARLTPVVVDRSQAVGVGRCHEAAQPGAVEMTVEDKTTPRGLLLGNEAEVKNVPNP